MSGAEAFHPIAGLLGIETRHTDALGVIHEPDAETLAAMVSAFGLPADQATAALADMQTASQGLDPWRIVAAEAPVLDLPPANGSAEWRLDFEQGGYAAGSWNSAEGQLHL